MENKDQPAYPIENGTMHIIHQTGFDSSLIGLTKREAFTLAAMQGLCASGEFIYNTIIVKAELAVAIADFTLNALAKEKGEGA